VPHRWLSRPSRTHNGFAAHIGPQANGAGATKNKLD
jgi:hypothetical protein